MALDQTMVEAVLAHHSGYLTDSTAQDAAWAQAVERILNDPALEFEDHWALYTKIFGNRAPQDGPPVAWRPTQQQKEHANISSLALEQGCHDYTSLHAWSVANRGDFWGAMAARLGIHFATKPVAAIEVPVNAENPVWFPRGEMNIAESCFQAPADRVAIINAQEGTDALQTMTYGELDELSNRVANGLQGNDILPGDGVALYMPMTPACVAAYLGIIKAGCHVVSIPDSFAPAEVATRLRLGGAKAVITMESFLRGGKPVPMYAKIQEARKLLTDEGHDGFTAVVIEANEVEDGDHPWDDFLPDDTFFRAVTGDPNRTCNVLFSSGTTGEPKAIPWTHLTPIKAASDGYLHQDIHATDIVAWPTNIGWMMGPWLIFATFVNQATMFLYQGVPTTPHFIQQTNEAKVTVLGVVPAIVRAWKSSGVRPHALPDVRVFSSTGEASNAHDYLYLMSVAGYHAPIIEYCGGTEIGGGHLTGTVVQDASPATFTTPALGIDFVILDDGQQHVAAGGMGEIYLVPPSIGLSQTLLNKDHHAQYFEGVPPGPEGQILRRHGDQVQVLHGGYWAAQGRADDTMNLGGIKVGSIELETAMNEHPGVLETAAVAVQPAAGGADQLVVFAVLEGPAAADLKKELQALIKQHLNPLFRIHDVVVVDKLPRTASNKVMRRELRSQYAPVTA